MNRQRLGLVFGNDFAFHTRRPLVWVLLILLALTSWGLSTGHVTIQSGDTSIGGHKQPFITSEFANAKMLPMVAFLFYSFFLAVAAGMAIPRDDELNVGPVLHATRLQPSEYVWGKFLAALVTFCLVMVVHLNFAAFFNHLVPNADAERIRGPFSLVNYLRPAAFIALPFVVFLAGTSFFIGERSRRPILVFVMPVAVFVVCIFFLWDWSPSWLDPRINKLLQWIEPSGFRWMNETWTKVDLGVDYYNTRPVGYDVPFLLSRLAYAVVGLLAVAASAQHFGATLRGSAKVSERRRRGAAEPEAVPEFTSKRLSTLAMTSKAPGFVRTVLDVAAFESRNVASQPGLYIFVPLILLQVIGSSFFQVGAFDTPLLITSGTAAVDAMNTLTLLVCFLLLFYTTESVLREKAVRLDHMFWATPARTAAVLFGKAIANGLVGLVILFAAWIGSTIVILVQGKVHPGIWPYLLTWGGLLTVTFITWASFVTAVIAATGDRWATYSVGLAVIAFTGWKQFKQAVNWVGNWDLWSATTWTDFGGLDPNGPALLLNRLFYLAVTAFLVAWTVRMFPRREPDSGAALDRLRPGRLVGSVLRLSPVMLPAIALGALLYVQVSQGYQGKAAERREKEYHGRNLVTWNDVKGPAFGGVDLDLELDPAKHFFHVKGTYALVNHTDKPMHRFPMSVGNHFEKIEWTLADKKFEPEDHARMYVFNLPQPLAPGDTVRLGFSHQGYFPKGITKNGGGMGQFILPSGVVLTSFGTSFLPMPFFEGDRGVKEENKLDPKDWEDGFWEGITPPGIGTGALFPVRTKITGPAGWDYHGVGVRREDTVANGKRTVVWETDHPVNFFNVVAGKWDTWKGDGVEVNYLAAHKYNVQEIGDALVAARKWYSEWFYPYPWHDLRLNEFAGLASYAQGFPTNITFSEGIGFLTRSKPEAQVAFLVTAHESAHQWWGNILLPGEGPGGDILSEGMAHFSTILLYGQVKGLRERIEFCKRIEHRYGDRRQVDSEKPLAWVDGSKAGDETATYDKGGWAAWMLYNLMGKEADLAGVHDFIERYHANIDHPVIQDFTRVMREHAPDSTAYDAFVKQWYYSVVMPQYTVKDAKRNKEGGAWTVTATVENTGTGKMPVQVAAVAGDRWAEEDKAKDPKKHKDAKPWHEARSSVVLGAGEKATVTLHPDFEPEKVVVDPDALVLMLKRDAAEAKL